MLYKIIRALILPVTTIIFLLLFASPAYAATNTCNLPINSASTLRDFAKARGIIAGSSGSYSECVNHTSSATEQALCLKTIGDNFTNMMAGGGSWPPLNVIQGLAKYIGIDPQVKFAKANNMKLQFFHGIWKTDLNDVNKMFPDYLLPGQTGSSCGTRTSASLLPLIQGRMNSILTYNPSVINAINVVNEEFVGAGYGLNCYRTIIGAPLFIDKAFQYARAADPHATLVLNEAFYNEAIDAFQYAIDRYEIDFVFNYVKDAKKRGIPIDAVGVQNHLNVDSGIHFTQQYLDDLDYLFAKARDAGVKVIFTEMEVYQTRGKTQTDVATVYKNTMAKCLTNSNCLGIYFWGISDKFGASGTNSTLFDASYNRKPAYNAVMDALRENTTRGCTGIPVTATPTPIRIPGDITDVGDVPGDQVNIFDYNLVLSNFGNPYTIFDYNNVIANFGK